MVARHHGRSILDRPSFHVHSITMRWCSGIWAWPRVTEHQAGEPGSCQGLFQCSLEGCPSMSTLQSTHGAILSVRERLDQQLELSSPGQGLGTRRVAAVLGHLFKRPSAWRELALRCQEGLVQPRVSLPGEWVGWGSGQYVASGARPRQGQSQLCCSLTAWS